MFWADWLHGAVSTQEGFGRVARRLLKVWGLRFWALGFLNPKP